MGLRDKNHWEDHYTQELKNFSEDGDEGEIWFGENLNRNIANWLYERIKSHLTDTIPHAPKQIRVVDIGCGNCQLLITLNNIINNAPSRISKEQLQLNLLGIDFAPSAVELSRQILMASSKEQDCNVKVQQCDILDFDQIKEVATPKAETYDYVLDKGTFDAICLIAEGQNSDELPIAIERYKRSLGLLLDLNSVFILASCNNTEEELVELFCGPLPRDADSRKSHSLRTKGAIKTPTFSFGGKTGSQVACLIFELALEDSNM